MNPLLYKAHPLLYRTVDLFIEPGAYTAPEIAALLLVYLSLNVIWCEIFRRLWKQSTGLVPTRHLAYRIALPSLVGYLPIMLTVTNDILHHQFRFADRALLVFVLFVVVQMLTVFHAVCMALRRAFLVSDLQAGFTLSLALLLSALPFSLAVMGLESAVHLL